MRAAQDMVDQAMAQTDAAIRAAMEMSAHVVRMAEEAARRADAAAEDAIRSAQMVDASVPLPSAVPLPAPVPVPTPTPASTIIATATAEGRTAIEVLQVQVAGGGIDGAKAAANLQMLHILSAAR
mgnify:FL=1